MYFSKGVYSKKAYFNDADSFDFLEQSCRLSLKAFNNGVVFDKKKNAPVLYATTVKDFNSSNDNVIFRKEMNKRGILRDFVGIDWDFNKGEIRKLKEAIIGIKKFSKKYNTSFIIYPTNSYPNKPRMRSVFFVDKLLNADEYTKAVIFILKEIGVDPKDNNNYDIKHPFNMPSISNEKQIKMIKVVGKERLNYEVFKDTKVPKKMKKKSTKIKTYELIGFEYDLEKEKRSDKDVDKAIKYILEQMDSGHSMFDFDDYATFVVKFMHSLARAEVIGAINREQSERILKAVAQGNSDYERRNVSDYEVEYNRVSSDENQLKMASPFQRYAGMEW